MVKRYAAPATTILRDTSGLDEHDGGERPAPFGSSPFDAFPDEEDRV
jgi:hypothetical protein